MAQKDKVDDGYKIILLKYYSNMPTQKQSNIQKQSVNVKVVVGDTCKPKKRRSAPKKKQPTLADIPVNNNIQVRAPDINITGLPVVPSVYRPATTMIQPENPLSPPPYFQSYHTNQMAALDSMRESMMQGIEELQNAMAAHATNAQHLANIQRVGQDAATMIDDQLNSVASVGVGSGSVGGVDAGVGTDVGTADIGVGPEDFPPTPARQQMLEEAAGPSRVAERFGGVAPQYEGTPIAAQLKSTPPASPEAVEEGGVDDDEFAPSSPRVQQPAPIVGEANPHQDTINRVLTLWRNREKLVGKTSQAAIAERARIEAQIKQIGREDLPTGLAYKPNATTGMSKIKNEILRRLGHKEG